MDWHQNLYGCCFVMGWLEMKGHAEETGGRTGLQQRKFSPGWNGLRNLLDRLRLHQGSSETHKDPAP